ncbi:MAG: hypothetical protein IJO14_13210 [Clostridia bacterium]|nr:hypothetical protein [Clostridia bacterium]
MKKMQNTKRALALLLVMLMMFPIAGIRADAATVETITDSTLKQAYLTQFNSVVNSVKKNRPGVTIKATGELLTDELAADDKMAQLGGIVVQNVFANDNSLTADLMDAFSADGNTEKVKVKTVTYDKGEAGNDKLPVAGKDYVSDLSMDCKFTMKKLRSDVKKTTEIMIQFPDCKLTDALSNDMAKVFDLPVNTSLNLDEENSVVLEDGVFQIDDIYCTDAYVDIIYDDNMQLVTYTSNITYNVTVRMFTVLESLWPIAFKGLAGLGFNTGEIAKFNPITVIMSLIGIFTGFDPDAALSSSDMFAKYNVKYQMYKLDWTPRYYGDVNGDNRVEADDARAILRAAVGLANFVKASDRHYADMDFNSTISAADARLALRVSVKLEKKFTSYEMRQEQINGNWEDPEEPEEPPVVPEEPDVPEIPFD